ncbi:hypothetical protein PIIN_08697 [Serendipita indica DSM 11827]|uniref:Uncharacterized protein n=1 Tax=Serendipita indica (strain DSM 11827) TaxID=1109443 RepID=G4TTU6_SERID|nr:hypothetical protein PIIN_08697 [Serendipita indica DSM 11827]
MSTYDSAPPPYTDEHPMLEKPAPESQVVAEKPVIMDEKPPIESITEQLEELEVTGKPLLEEEPVDDSNVLRSGFTALNGFGDGEDSLNDEPEEDETRLRPLDEAELLLPAKPAFKSVGSRDFRLVGAKPHEPSRFVTVGSSQYTTIKASISSMEEINWIKKLKDEKDEEEARLAASLQSQTVEEEAEPTSADEAEEVEYPVDGHPASSAEKPATAEGPAAREPLHSSDHPEDEEGDDDFKSAIDSAETPYVAQEVSDQSIATDERSLDPSL